MWYDPLLLRQTITLSGLCGSKDFMSTAPAALCLAFLELVVECFMLLLSFEGIIVHDWYVINCLPEGTAFICLISQICDSVYNVLYHVFRPVALSIKHDTDTSHATGHKILAGILRLLWNLPWDWIFSLMFPSALGHHTAWSDMPCLLVIQSILQCCYSRSNHLFVQVLIGLKCFEKW